MLAWTVVLGLVFSAGLITGQRLLRADAHGPMVSLSSTTLAKRRAATNGEAARPLRTTFSFYEHLTASKEASAEPARDAEEAPAAEDVPIEKPEDEAPDEEVVAPVEKPEADPAAGEQEVPVEKHVKEEASEKPSEAPAEGVERDESAERRAPERVIDELVDAVRGEPEEATPGEESKQALPARYTLQVSSHPDRASAEREMTRLRNVGLEPHVISVDVPGRGKLWRIRIGKFHSMNEARAFQGSLDSRRGVAGFVTPL